MEEGTIREMTLAWGKTPGINEDVIRVSGLGVAVCADGANGLHVVSPREAEARGLYVDPGQALIPLVAYHPDDEGPRSKWEGGRTKPKGLDAPENLTGPRVVQAFGVGAGSYLTKTALVNPSYGEGDPRRYFDSTKVCGWVLPGSTLRALGIGLGDLAAITYKGVTVWAQAYDVGPERSEKLEISVEACRQLGIPDDARSGGVADGVEITILKGSRRLAADEGKVRPWTPKSAAEIAPVAQLALDLRKEVRNAVLAIRQHQNC